MKFTMTRSYDENFDEVIEFRGKILVSDISKLKLNSFDHKLLDEDTQKSAADHLLLLEMLFRRHQEQLTSSDSVDII